MNLSSCKTEMNSIINDLKVIQSDIGRDFIGIGEQLCANRIGELISKYQDLLKKLKKLNS